MGPSRYLASLAIVQEKPAIFCEFGKKLALLVSCGGERKRQLNFSDFTDRCQMA
jgi:hypothetical protein